MAGQHEHHGSFISRILGRTPAMSAVSRRAIVDRGKGLFFLQVEAANGPTTEDGDKVLRERGITVLPDIIANGGDNSHACQSCCRACRSRSQDAEPPTSVVGYSQTAPADGTAAS